MTDEAEYRRTEDELEIDLRGYAEVLWRRKWLLFLSVVLVAGAALIVSLLQWSVYEASTTLLINQAPDSQTSGYNAILTSERLARTYAQMLSNRTILEETLNRSGLNYDIEEFAEDVEVSLVRDTQLIDVRVENTSPIWAAHLANTLVEVFVEENNKLQAERYAASKSSLGTKLAELELQIAVVESLIEDSELQDELTRLEDQMAQYLGRHTALLQSFEELRLAEAQSISNVVQLDLAVPPDGPVRPRTLLNTALAAIVGGMLAVGAIFLLEYLDDTIKSPQQVESALGLPVLGAIARIEQNHAEGKPHVVINPLSPIAEAFRALRTNIQFAGVDARIRTLLITSAGPEEGKSSVCVNLGAIMADGGRSTIVMEADLRRPRVHHLLGVSQQPGLSDLFVQDLLSLDGALQGTEITGLRAISSGELPPNPSELLGSARMGGILEALQREADLIILDSSPAAVVTDPVLLSEKVDAVLLVVEPGKTELASARHAVAMLRRAGANLIGVVLNNIPPKRSGYYGSYRYQYSSSYESDAGRARSSSAD